MRGKFGEFGKSKVNFWDYNEVFQLVTVENSSTLPRNIHIAIASWRTPTKY